MPTTLLGTPMQRAHTPTLVLRGVRQVFSDRYKVYDKGTIEEIFNMETPGAVSAETDVLTSEMGQALPTSENASPWYDSMQEVLSKTVTFVKYTLAAEITEEAVEDNMYQKLISRIGDALARAQAYNRQVRAWSFFNDLTETIYAWGGTNYQLLETAHPLLNGSTWANQPTVATTLSRESLVERLQAWTTEMVTLRGLKMDTQPRVLMFSAVDQDIAYRILNATKIPQSADNDPNWIGTQGLRGFMNPHLTTDNRWFLLGSKEDHLLTFFDRIKASVKDVPGDDTGNIRMRSRARFEKRCLYPFNIAGSPGT